MNIEFKISRGESPKLKVPRDVVVYELVRQLPRNDLLKLINDLKLEHKTQHPNQDKL